jgi:uncharacterized protein YegL
MANSNPEYLGEPGAPRRDVHFFWLLDGSTSMVHDERIQSLNYAIAIAIPEMRRIASEQWTANVLVRALRFANDVEWLVERPTPVDQFEWTTDMVADGETAMGKALSAVADELAKLDVRGKYYPPVIILITDGEPTDPDGFETGLQRLLDQRLGRVSTRIAIAIKVTERGMDCLKKFADVILPAEKADEIAQSIEIASTSGIMMSTGAGKRIAPRN